MLQLVGAVIAAGALSVIAGCSYTPDLRINSHVNSEYKVTKKEPVVIALPTAPSDDDVKFVDVARDGLQRKGIVVVDDVAQASRIVTFHVDRNLSAQQSARVDMSHIDDRGDGLRYNHAQRSSFLDSGVTRVYVRMIDVSHARTQNTPVVWEAFIVARDEHFEKYPAAVLDYLLLGYGKKRNWSGLFKEPIQQRSGTR